jgi:ABC-2 type transport system ATP-binding protein
MADSLRELAAVGAAIPFSSHQLDLVENICQNVVVIDDGRVVQSGALDDLWSRSNRRILQVRVNGADGRPRSVGAAGGAPPGTAGTSWSTAGSTSAGSLRRPRPQSEVGSFSFEPPSLSDLSGEAVTR